MLPREKGVPLAEVQLSKNGATEGVESSASKLKSLMRTNDGLQACSRSRKRRKCPWTRGGENKGSPGALNWRVNDAGGQEDELGAFVSAASDACPSDKTPLHRHDLHALAVVAAAHLRDTAVPLVPHCRIRGWRSVGHQRWGTTASDTTPPVHDQGHGVEGVGHVLALQALRRLIGGGGFSLAPPVPPGRRQRLRRLLRGLRLQAVSLHVPQY
ncbi:uncharacterized protein LOC127764032 [Oryza glaberrima]|uniref:uncharacterized protein LOC127764032 n=1 Tax=Oryza glaberrima TaxID=4538 RepID=UPI00224BFEE2|nr:uncharacterized protein LOC127764032 [Oryza glaberrima]